MLKLVSSNDIVKHSVVRAEDIPEGIAEVIHHCLGLMIPDESIRVVVVMINPEDGLEMQTDFISESEFLKYFLIEICSDVFDDYEPSKIVQMTCHECVHIKQWVYGELDYSDDTWFWHGEAWPFECEIDYWFQPWEVEANGLEHALHQSWFGRFRKEWQDFYKLLEEKLYV